jgi:hypothetical protein
MKLSRGPFRVVTTLAVAMILTGINSAAMAYPSNITEYDQATRTGAKFSSGTGQIRAKQECESSSGQTDWWVYGYWMVKSSTSWTSDCSTILDRGYELTS